MAQLSKLYFLFDEDVGENILSSPTRAPVAAVVATRAPTRAIGGRLTPSEGPSTSTSTIGIGTKAKAPPTPESPSRARAPRRFIGARSTAPESPSTSTSHTKKQRLRLCDYQRLRLCQGSSDFSFSCTDSLYDKFFATDAKLEKVPYGG